MTTTNTIITLDPRDEGSPSQALLATRPTNLNGKTIGLFSNNKPHSEKLLRMIADVIRERYEISGIIEHNKGGHQWTAKKEDLETLAPKCDIAIHATAE
jgi:hypothetical protein|tara:strand:- start:63 stop:359 length:297 start_codon:yes stop_codon:yes gene_type:complete